MNKVSDNIAMVQTIARGLEELRDRVVFVGGAIASLYIEDGATRTVRPTEDVDCVIRIAGRSEFTAIEEKLREKSFRHCTEKGSPLCRWVYNGVKVDVMPNDPEILGFANRWYNEGFNNTVRICLPDGQKISMTS